jgi:transcriptional regulator with XRE-family HTH domain
MYDNLDKEASFLLDTISQNIIKYRKEKGYSQLQLATEIGYASASYFGRMEIRKNDEHFNIVQLYKISRVLDVELYKFFETPIS